MAPRATRTPVSREDCGTSVIRTVGTENGTDINLWYEDHGAGRPVVLIHGTADLNTPFEATGGRLPALLPGLKFIRVDGAPHLLPWVHPEVVNPALLDFCQR